VIGSPASSVAVTCSGASRAETAFSSREAGASTRAYAGSPKRSTRARYRSLGGSRSVPGSPKQADTRECRPCPSSTRCRSRAASLRRPRNPGMNHLNPTGTSTSQAPEVGRDPVDHVRADGRLADRRIGKPGRRGWREKVVDGDDKGSGWVSGPASGVTTLVGARPARRGASPWRGAACVLATQQRSATPTSDSLSLEDRPEDDVDERRTEFLAIGL
jgi:hypothetical protein